MYCLYILRSIYYGELLLKLSLHYYSILFAEFGYYILHITNESC